MTTNYDEINEIVYTPCVIEGHEPGKLFVATQKHVAIIKPEGCDPDDMYDASITLTPGDTFMILVTEMGFEISSPSVPYTKRVTCVNWNGVVFYNWSKPTDERPFVIGFEYTLAVPLEPTP
jgi:hypothetical protein